METQVHKTAVTESDAEKLERVLQMTREHKGRDGCLIQVLHRAQEIDRKSVVYGKIVYIGGRRFI